MLRGHHTIIASVLAKGREPFSREGILWIFLSKNMFFRCVTMFGTKTSVTFLQVLARFSNSTLHRVLAKGL